jgi:hypothetical protein
MWVRSIGGMIPTQKDKYAYKNLLHCNFVQHKSYMNWPGKESGFVLAEKVEHSQQIKK